jgi:hypothetical protein
MKEAVEWRVTNMAARHMKGTRYTNNAACRHILQYSNYKEINATEATSPLRHRRALQRKQTFFSSDPPRNMPFGWVKNYLPKTPLNFQREILTNTNSRGAFRKITLPSIHSHTIHIYTHYIPSGMLWYQVSRSIKVDFLVIQLYRIRDATTYK